MSSWTVCVHTNGKLNTKTSKSKLTCKTSHGAEKLNAEHIWMS